MKMKWIYYLIGANFVVLLVLLSVMSIMPADEAPVEVIAVPPPTDTTIEELDEDSLPEPAGSEAWCDALIVHRHREWTQEEVRTFSEHCLHDLSN